jgi:hypothetical protein
MSLGKYKTKLLGKSKIDYKEIYFFWNTLKKQFNSKKKCIYINLFKLSFININIIILLI